MFREKRLDAGAGFKPADLQNMNLSSRHCSIPAMRKFWRRRRDLNSHRSVYKTDALETVKLFRRSYFKFQILKLNSVFEIGCGERI